MSGRLHVPFVSTPEPVVKRMLTLAGIKPGERYVADGAHVLKAELAKGEGGHEH